jgi:hypothetical protein
VACSRFDDDEDFGDHFAATLSTPEGHPPGEENYFSRFQTCALQSLYDMDATMPARMRGDPFLLGHAERLFLISAIGHVSTSIYAFSIDGSASKNLQAS